MENRFFAFLMYQIFSPEANVKQTFSLFILIKLAMTIDILNKYWAINFSIFRL